MSEVTERESRYTVTLNGVSMASLSPDIVITDVNYEAPQYDRETFKIAKKQGAMIVSEYKERAAVTISFMIRTYPVADRQEVCQSIIRWARDGGDLRINDREGQKLICICDQLPAIESVKGWTDELSISFAAYDIPYWQAVTPTVVTAHIPDGEEVDYSEGFTEITLTVPGSAPKAYMDMVVEHTADYIYGGHTDVVDQADPENYFEIHGGYGDVGTRQYRSFEVNHDENGICRVFQNYEDSGTEGERDILFAVLNNDDLTVPCGKTTTLSFRYGWTNGGADVAPTRFCQKECDVTFTVRGLWE